MNYTSEKWIRNAADQIKKAMGRSGMTRKQLAAMTGRSPSEVTRWLSGRHNFTLGLLAEISDALGYPITGYPEQDNCVCLEEPSPAYGYSIGDIHISPQAYIGLSQRARNSRVSLQVYIKGMLEEKGCEEPISAADFCGIWKDVPDDIIDDIKKCRTQNTTVIL